MDFTVHLHKSGELRLMFNKMVVIDNVQMMFQDLRGKPRSEGRRGVARDCPGAPSLSISLPTVPVPTQVAL